MRRVKTRRSLDAEGDATAVAVSAKVVPGGYGRPERPQSRYAIPDMAIEPAAAVANRTFARDRSIYW